MLVPRQNEMAIARALSTNGKEDYEFREVPSGSYHLMAFTGNGGTDLMGGNQTFSYGYMGTIEVGDGDIAGFNVSLQPLRDLPVNVTFRGCVPFPVRITALNSSPLQPPPSEAVTTLDGAAVLRRLATGPYKVFVNGVESSRYITSVESMRLAGRDVMKDGFDSPLATDEALQVVVACVR
jgi:hypothetical protein